MREEMAALQDGVRKAQLGKQHALEEKAQMLKQMHAEIKTVVEDKELSVWRMGEEMDRVLAEASRT